MSDSGGSDDRQLARWLEDHMPAPVREPDWSDVSRRAKPPRSARRSIFGAIAVVAATAVAIVVLIVAGGLRTKSSGPPASGKSHAGSLADGTYLVTFASITRDGAGWKAAITPSWTLQEWSDMMTSEPRADDSRDAASGSFFGASDATVVVGSTSMRQELCGTESECATAELRVTTTVQTSELRVAPTVQVSRCGGGDTCSRITHPAIAALASSTTIAGPAWVRVQAGAIVKIADPGSAFQEFPDVKAVITKLDGRNAP